MADGKTQPVVSKALEANIACTQVQVEIDEGYQLLYEIMEHYPGLREGLHSLLEEVCHPYRNWPYILKEARAYALNYLHLLVAHPKGPSGARIYADIFFQALLSSDDEEVRARAADNLLLFVQRLIKFGSDAGPEFSPVVEEIFQKIVGLSDQLLFLFVKSFYRLEKIAHALLENWGMPLSTTASLLLRFHHYTYSYWLGQRDPLEVFKANSGLDELPEEIERLFLPISHRRIKELVKELDDIKALLSSDPRKALTHLIEMPSYGEIVDYYNGLPRALFEAGKGSGQGYLWRLIFLLAILGIEGLSSIHEEALRNINKVLGGVIENEPLDVSKAYLERVFQALKANVIKYSSTTLNCVLNMGKAVYRTDESELVDFFIDLVISLGFHTPDVRGVGEDWQIRANQSHVQNIRTWLELIELKPIWSKKLLSSLIIYLSLCGVLIKDTDLFPRDITRLLNSPIGPVYNLVKQLARLFPAYFNDIGAEGKLRDISTQIDEVCLRKDPLVHFLRKQSHVESSNRIVELMEAVLGFWLTKDKTLLEAHLPPTIYEQVSEEGKYIDGVHKVLAALFREKGLREARQLLGIEESQVEGVVGRLKGVTEVDKKRVKMAITLYKLFHQKYHPLSASIESTLAQVKAAGLPEHDRLKRALALDETHKKVSALLDYLETLKGIILSQESYEIREDIYHKRHFTVDIPSMYGRYHELKFDALGLTFRIEALLGPLFEEMVENIDLGLVTRATISQIFQILQLFKRALELEGLRSVELDRQLDLVAHSLEIRGFSSTQYIDIFRGLTQAVNNIVHDHFNNIHEGNLQRILKTLPRSALLSKYCPKDAPKELDKLVHRVSEVFLRERIASTLGLQALDRLLGKILHTLYKQSIELEKEHLRQLLNFDPQKALTPIFPVRKKVADLIHLGNKGLNLVKMAGIGVPVPPGFIITTEVFRCRHLIEHYEPARRNFREQIRDALQALQEKSGKRLGEPSNPLLLSVRSGSSISQPGMMNTFLNVGINHQVVEGLADKTSNPWFAWDTYRRFLQAYGMGYGLERDRFDAIIAEAKARWGVEFKREFSGQQMKEVALRYERLLQDHGVVLETDPLEQLYVAISKVFESWFSDKAVAYRKIMGISDDWGTAVTVQAMVFGNYSNFSGSGVFFTHDPRWSGDMLVLWGDFTPGNQGEDVVSGLVRTLPVSSRQAEIENRDPQASLECMFPQIYQEMRKWAKKLIYDEGWSPQEMEFTFEDPGPQGLYFLQARDMFMRERKRTQSFELQEKDKRNFLGHGIGVSGGALSGRVVFNLEDIEYWRNKEPGTPLILVRNDTVPDDIKEIHEADGLLTARGGSTSHAAIVAHRLGKTCVVGCGTLICNEKDRTCSVGHVALAAGSWISIDGTEGSVYKGKMKVRRFEV